MALRPSMKDLIRKVRLQGSDPAGENQTFADEEVQDFCDQNRRFITGEVLMCDPKWVSGVMSYSSQFSEWKNWEADVRIEDAQGTELELNEVRSDPLDGAFYLQDSTQMVGYATGKVYDVAGAVADMLEAWAGKVMLEFDFRDTDQQYSRSQKQENILKLAKQWRQRAWVRETRMGRNDGR